MNPIRCAAWAACAVLLGVASPAWAVNKCTGADGKVSFQDAPCDGAGEKVDVRPAMEGATPIQPGPSVGKEGAFGASWQRKNHLQNQAILNLRASWQFNPKLSATLAVNNVTNQKYWANLDYGNYADPRNVSVTLRAAF
jgi:hypothetical protein